MFLGVIGACMLAAPHAVEAQRTAKLPKIGYINVAPERNQFDVAFDQALNGLGYAEGQNILIERRYTGGRADRLASLAMPPNWLVSIRMWSLCGPPPEPSP